MLTLMGSMLAAVTTEMEFGGQQWRVKTSHGPVAPGPNYWSNSSQSVWLDDQGMHLTISKRDEIWYATEIFTRAPLGYGTYVFTVDSDFSAYDPNIVAGFFTWDTQNVEANREIDIEFASWGIPQNMYGQYVVQPFTSPDRIKLFNPKMQGTYSTHRIVWTPSILQFASWHGAIDPESPEAFSNLMAEWTFNGQIPTEGRARFRINLWLFQGREPASEATTVLTIKSFSFVPWQ
ncbi:MAG: serine protease [Sphaerochaetaceae bacterium]|nr:serine protease [Sphaerochaetaceae bacterium]NLO60585.1 serine protease [Spirochaetales bacterium]MDD2405988.1 serine protease [Sphaerochaetaceae bacterium]MDD3670017.1 serine protease [Sphaerochaetaceae bacterium]MDD4259838.1 serine protease [Sphaerochaetaceae bacterium]